MRAARPLRVVEIAAFLIIPALPPLIFGLQVSDAITAVIESAVFLAIVYVATSYGLIGSLAWALRRAAAQVGNLGRLLTRALPLLMVFIAFTFLSNTVWQVAAALTWQQVAIVILFFLVLSLRLSRRVAWCRRFAASLRPTTIGPTRSPPLTARPREALRAEVADAVPPAVPLRWHEWVNVGTFDRLRSGHPDRARHASLFRSPWSCSGCCWCLCLSSANWVRPPDHPAVYDRSWPAVTRNHRRAARSWRSSLVRSRVSISPSPHCPDSAYRSEFFSDADREMREVFAVRSVYHAARLVGVPQIQSAEVSSGSGVSDSQSAPT